MIVRIACRLFLLLLVVGMPLIPRAGDLTILQSSKPGALEEYAARELSRYVYALAGALPAITAGTISTNGYIIGRRGTHPLIDQLLTETIGAQGYVLKKTTLNDKDIILIAANDESGILYGVYGLLEEHYGIQFNFDGDVLPSPGTELFPAIDESKTPAVAIRGFLPWTNFPQSATSYSWEDWKYILDQMARMRMNFLQIHNYNGEEGHNEMFHNFEVDGNMSRVWMATARSGHAWGSYPGWDVNKYLFGSSSLFDDYDFGADCALHNEKLTNKQVFRKGVNEFQRVIAYAHKRGI
ncbi:MAG TPA: alpha-glucuronidase family glycosyl hydrolase, partial [Niastella sp.]|nr:alpha-glucuronidase family glycosyl hydrolase [Niastella sp.]